MIHVIVSTVTNLDVVFPIAAFAFPVITNLSNHYALLYAWVYPIEPTRCVGTAVIYRNAILWNVITSLPHHAIPPSRYVIISSITFILSIIVVCCTAGVVNCSIFSTLVWLP